MIRAGDGVLGRYTRDLTADARRGRLEPVRCRHEEISRVIDILLRQGKNNPALVGPAGVGKTAIAEGLAQRIAAGQVPLAIRDVRLLAVDHVSLLGGTMYRGQYEERIRGLVAETTQASDVILFVDELHNLIGQGTAMGVAMDAGNMLKPALVRGDFRVIGATTTEEYERWVGGDPALERRFQRVMIRELSAGETLEILRARVERLERHHNVRIAPATLEAVIELTDRYQTDRMRPDRALDALDEACAHAHAEANYSPELEALILRRRDLLRARAAAAPRGATNGSRAGARHTAQGMATSESAAHDPTHPDDDTIDRLARDSFAALERFGAELEAMFVAAPERPASESSDASSPGGPEPAGSASSEQSASLAELEAELDARLIAEGIVVRPHDVARVVRVATGKEVTWEGEEHTT
jgi:ATP-dependent Clp protease ATP-binding subunit ClpA